MSLDSRILLDFDVRKCLTGSFVTPSSGGNVTYLADSGPLLNSGHVQGTAGNQPKYFTNIFGSLPGLLFDGVDDYMLGISAYGMGATGYTLIAVHLPDAAVALDATIWSASATMSNNHQISASPSIGTAWGGKRGNLASLAAYATVPANGVPMITSFVTDSVGFARAGCNGRRLQSTAVPTLAFTSGGTYALGATVAPSSFYKGYMARILVLLGALTEKDLFAIERQLGAIYGVTGQPVVLPMDRPITIESGKTYKASVYDTTANQAPTDIDFLGPMVGAFNAFALVGTTSPLGQSPVIIKPSDLSPETWRVIGLSEEAADGKLEFGVTAVNYNASKFSAVDNGTLLEAQQTSSLPTPYAVGVPTSVTAAISYVSIGAGQFRETLEVNWSAPNDPMVQSYVCRYRKDQGNWTIFNGDTTATNANFPVNGFGSYEIDVRSVNRSSITSASAGVTYLFNETTIATATVSPGSQDFVTSLVLTALAESGIVIRYTLDGSDPTVQSAEWPGGLGSYTTLTISISLILKVRGFLGYYASGITTYVYNLAASASTSTVATPVFSRTNHWPQPGVVTLTCATAGATIKYSKNGGAFTTYSVPFAMASNATQDIISWYALKAGMNDSPADSYDNSYDPN